MVFVAFAIRFPAADSCKAVFRSVRKSREGYTSSGVSLVTYIIYIVTMI